MASVVTIQIKLDNSQVLPSIDQLNNAMTSVGVQGTASFSKASDGARNLGGHAATSLDAVRLLSQEFGLRLPRAIEAMLSRVPAVTNVLTSLVGVMAGFAGVEIFIHMGEEAVELYKKVYDVDKMMREYIATAGTAATQKLFDEASLETSIELLRQANTQVEALTARRNAVDIAALVPGKQYDVLSPGNSFNMQDGANLAKASADTATADHRNQLLARQDEMEGMKNRQAAQEQTLRGLDLIEAKRRDAHAVDALAQKQQIDNEQELVTIARTSRDYQLQSGMRTDDPKLTPLYVTSPDAGREAQRIADEKADEDAAAQYQVANRDAALAVMKARGQVREAGLAGDALEVAKRSDGIRELTLQLQSQGKARQQIDAEVAALEAKLDDEHDTRLQKQFQDAQQAMRTARQSGLTGAARIHADQGNEIDRNNSNRAIDPEARHQLNIAAATTANQKLKELDDNFTASTKQLIDQRTADQLGGFARIDAEARRSIAERQKQYDAAYKDDHDRDTATPQQHQMLVDSIAAIDNDAAAKKTELTQRNNAEDLQYAQEATRAELRVREDGIMGWVAAHQNGLIEIQAQEQERMAKLDADAVKEGLTAQQVAQRRADIEREASAEVAQQNQQLQHQIASNLQSAFTDPIGYIKSRMQQMFFEILAQWLVQSQMFKTLFGNTMSTLSPGARGTSGAAGAVGAATNTGGLLGGLIPGMRGITNGSPNISSIYAPDTTANNSGTGGGAITAVDSGTLALARVARGSGTASQTGAILNTSTAGGRVDLSGGGAGTLSMPQLPGFGGGISSTAHASGASNGALALPQIPGISGGVAAPAHASSASSAISDVGSALSTAQRSGILRSSSSGGVDLTGSAGGFNTNGATAPGVTDSGDNGEGGGFAGSITGNTDDMSMAAAQRSADADPTGSGGGINAQASQQAAAANAPASSGAGLTSSIGKLAPVAMAGYSIESSTVNAFETNNPLKGALADAAAGAEIGTIFGGPIGTAIGAAAGAALGAASGLVGMATGEGSKMMARTYYEQTVQPQLEQIYNGAGSGDFQSEIASANSIASDAKAYMSTKFGIGASDWIDSNYMQKELLRVTQLISNTAEGGRQYVTLSAAQFHSGGLISGFGSLGTSSNEGYIHALLGETVMNPSASSTHAPMLSAMNSGASASDIASAYLASSSGAGTSSGSTDNSTHFHIHTMDPKNMDHWLQNGGAQQISKAQNNFSGQYAGDGISG